MTARTRLRAALSVCALGAALALMATLPSVVCTVTQRRVLGMVEANPSEKISLSGKPDERDSGTALIHHAAGRDDVAAVYVDLLSDGKKERFAVYRSGTLLLVRQTGGGGVHSVGVMRPCPVLTTRIDGRRYWILFKGGERRKWRTVNSLLRSKRYRVALLSLELLDGGGAE